MNKTERVFVAKSITIIIYLCAICFLGVEFDPWTVENITDAIEFLWLTMSFNIYRHRGTIESEKSFDFSRALTFS